MTFLYSRFLFTFGHDWCRLNKPQIGRASRRARGGWNEVIWLFCVFISWTQRFPVHLILFTGWSCRIQTDKLRDIRETRRGSAKWRGFTPSAPGRDTVSRRTPRRPGNNSTNSRIIAQFCAYAVHITPLINLRLENTTGTSFFFLLLYFVFLFLYFNASAVPSIRRCIVFFILLINFVGVVFRPFFWF